MAHRLLQDPDADGWERSDFPIVCETCLGPNPYVRMQKFPYGGECHISGRPYTVFRWKPGKDARYKKTIICQEVAKAKNVCQVCLLDLDYNLPVQVRDVAAGVENDDIPKSKVGQEYQLTEKEQKGELEKDYNTKGANDMILKLARTEPYYTRNMAHVCSFWIRGECKRGAECPYRHELPIEGELSKQNIRDRYYGVNDPVAEKMLSRVGTMPALSPPEDQTVTTLYVGGVSEVISENDIKDVFYVYGEISSVKVVHSRGCAFITFKERSDAEAAAEAKHNKLIIKGVRCKLSWGQPQQKKPEEGAEETPTMLPPQVQQQQQAQQNNYFNLQQNIYPSMDPSAMGSYDPSAKEDTLERPNKMQKVNHQGGVPPPPPPPQLSMYPPPPPPPKMGPPPSVTMRPPPPINMGLPPPPEGSMRPPPPSQQGMRPPPPQPPSGMPPPPPHNSMLPPPPGRGLMRPPPSVATHQMLTPGPVGPIPPMVRPPPPRAAQQ
eukprot:TRINITY_DN1785_c0_g3_i4.p1 TRINITY_DN1785_c0_g3~~TRINITY_DN1785_c0_g3_i4.p1  ORF type:complete len:510 (-),score=69.51 TRINITY_DN1785_c0_g3_i4:259-1734(-)